MKIVICGSMKLSEKMITVRDELLHLGHEVIAPLHVEEYASMSTSHRIHNESVKNKIQENLIRDYYEKIAGSDAVLIVNDELNGVHGYIGGNSFLEMGFAHVLHKKIYTLNDLPDVSYKDELIAMQPIILHGDVSLI
jgi:hypothetical protein